MVADVVDSAVLGMGWPCQREARCGTRGIKDYSTEGLADEERCGCGRGVTGALQGRRRE